VNIAQRMSYAETGATGQGVSETTDNKAGAEIAAATEQTILRGTLDLALGLFGGKIYKIQCVVKLIPNGQVDVKMFSYRHHAYNILEAV
jgi:hypothetical protein